MRRGSAQDVRRLVPLVHTVESAYRYQTAYGLTRYVLVERGSAGASSGYVGIWLQ